MAVRFDSGSDRWQYSGAVPDPATGFTVVFWAYLSVDRNDYSTMLRLSAGGSTSANIATDSNGTTLAYFTPGGSLISSFQLTVGAWNRIAATCIGTSGILYGADGGTGPTTVTSGTVVGAASPDALAIGGRGAGDDTEFFNGREQAFKIYSTVLTQSEIEAEWRQNMPLRTANLHAWYPLLNDADKNDYSGNGRHLTAGSAAAATEDNAPVPWSRAVIPTPTPTHARRRAALY